MKDFGNSRRKAKVVSITSNLQTLTNTIGKPDRTDFIKFNLISRSSFQATLSKLKANADLALINNSGQMLLRSKKRGKKNEAIATSLEAGTYFLKITPGSLQDKTSYRLRFSAAPLSPSAPTPPNAAPVLAVNVPLPVPKGGTPALINGTLLKATDPEQSTSQLLYSLTRLPEAGQIKLNGKVVKAGGTFTQADIDAGRLVYQRNIPLPTNSTNNGYPQISGSNAVWTGRSTDGGSDDEIFFFNGTSTIQLTTNTTRDDAPQVSGSNVVWRGQGGTDGGSDYEIFFFNGTSTIQLTTNNTDDFNPQVSGSNVVWTGRGTDGGGDSEIFFFNGTSTIQLTTNNSDDTAPQVSGSNIVWRSSPNTSASSSEIFFFNGTSITQLTNNSQGDYNPQISGSNVVWERGGAIYGINDREIFFFNGTTTTQLTSNTAASAQVSGSNVVWQGRGADGGTDSEIFFFNGTSTIQLTNNNTNDFAPQISGSNVVWYGSGGTDGGSDYEIFFFDGITTTQLTTNNTRDFYPQVSGSSVMWTGRDSNDNNSEIFLSNGATTDRFDFTISDGVGGATNGTFNLTLS
jgi:hypothetical protein